MHTIFTLWNWVRQMEVLSILQHSEICVICPAHLLGTDGDMVSGSRASEDTWDLWDCFCYGTLLLGPPR